MKKLIETTIVGALGAVSVLGASLVNTDEAHAQATSTVGALRGQIRDKATGEPAVGATVVATSPALVGEQVILTDENGLYFITSLPPGVYTLTIYYNDRNFSRSNVLVQLGKEAVVNVTVDSAAGGAGGGGGEVIEIQGNAPVIDQGSTKTGNTITDDYTRNVPVGRTFGAVLGAAAGSQGDAYGTSISGATSVENTYIVEGVNTTDTGFGGLSSNLPNEFVQETEIITGGYNAEFGRATGGIINVVTKTGSNEFHGSVFGYFRPSTFIADQRVIEREGSSIDSQTNLNYNYDLGAEVGGPIIKDKLWFHVGFNPSFTKQTTTRILLQQQDEDQDGIPDVDENGLTVRNQFAERDIPANFETYFFTAKINGAINQNNQFQISAFGNPRSAEDVFGVSRNPDATRWVYDDGAYDFSGKWTSKFNEGKTQVDAVIGYHHGFEDQRPFRPEDDVPLIFERATFERSLYDFAALEGMDTVAGCNDNDPSDPYPLITNCPTLGYASQGLGFLEQRTNTRTSAVVSLTQRVKAAGYHTFKAGIDAELSTYDSTRRYTGGQIFRHNGLETPTRGATWQLRELLAVSRNLTPEEIDAVRMDPTSIALEQGQTLCAGDRAICETADAIQANTDSRGIAAYLQDSWQVLPNLTLNAGIRYEQQVGFVAERLQGAVSPTGEIIPKEAYTLDNMWAPRLGFVYDPTKEGRAKIFGHWGRFYESVPLDINVRAFGGEITNFSTINGRRLQPGAEGYDPNCQGDTGSGPLGPNGTPGLADRLAACTDRTPLATLGEGTEYVSPGLKGQYTEEWIVGTEYQLVKELKFGLNFIHRSVPRIIEDISTDGANTYLITNPGSNFDDAAAELNAQADQLLMEGGCMSLEDTSPGCDADKQALAALNASRASQLSYVKNFDKPVRDYNALQIVATQRPTAKSLLIASYTYSQSKGNYPGLFSTETNQLDPNLTSLYDLPDLMANRYGNLGLDRPHNVKIDGFYAFDLAGGSRIVAGGSFRAQSGLPRNALAAHPVYGNGESYLLPRGDNGRTPVTGQVDARLSFGRKLNKTTLVEAFVNVFNLFNQQDVTRTDDNYTFDFVNPIVGGDPNDLAHAKTSDGNVTTTPNPNYGRASARQSARNVQFGVRLTF